MRYFISEVILSPFLVLIDIVPPPPSLAGLGRTSKSNFSAISIKSGGGGIGFGMFLASIASMDGRGCFIRRASGFFFGITLYALLLSLTIGRRGLRLFEFFCPCSFLVFTIDACVFLGASVANFGGFDNCPVVLIPLPGIAAT